MPSFQDLPVETIDLIFSKLVLHKDNTQSIYASKDQKVETKALLNLTKTSRLCRSIALPILFHNINQYHKGKYIFNMLISHQDLAQCIKDLALPFEWYSWPAYSYLKDIAQSLGVEGPVVSTLRHGNPMTAELSLALAVCSGVERLELQIPDHPWKKSFRLTVNVFKEISRELQAAPYLENLRYLEFFTGSASVWGIIPSGIPPLLQLSPRLEVLVLKGNEGCGGRHLIASFDLDDCRPALESLVEIQMIQWPLTNLNADTAVLKKILTATNSLTSFTYVCKELGIDHLFLHEHPPWQLVNMLLPVKSSLQHLTLDFKLRKINQGNHYRSSLTAHKKIAIDPYHLKQFTELKTIKLDQFSYCRHQFDREIETATHLADMLPISVRSLTMSFPRYFRGYQCLSCILHLGKRAAAGEFPALEYVQIDAPIIQHRKIEWIRRSASNWTREDRVQKEKMYDELLEDAARDEEDQRLKSVKAFAGSGVQLWWNSWRVVTREVER